MMKLSAYKKKLEELVPRDMPFTEEEIEKFFRNSSHDEFRRSLELLASEECMDKHIANTKLSRIDHMILLFKEIVGIEMLVGGKRSIPNREAFSLHSAWLLATNKDQLTEIQKYLGYLYEVRNFIVHALSLKDCRVFKTYFMENLQKVLKTANKYHRLILLRLIVKKQGIIPKKSLIKQLEQLRTHHSWDLPLPRYYEDITNEMKQITGIPSSPLKEAKSLLSLPPPEEYGCYRLGINSYGGLSELTHNEVGDYENFYHSGERIIPEESVWEELRGTINREIRKIREKQYSYVRIVPKAHLSILFYLGYRFYSRRIITLLTDFNGKEIELTPLKGFVDPNGHWSVRTNGLKLNNGKVVVILNVTRPLKAKVDTDRSFLELQEIPQIVFNCRCSNSKIIPNSQCISSENQIKQACRALELYFTQLQETHLLNKVHIFVRAPSAMMILLGMHFRLAGLNVVLYEYGKRSVDDDSKHFYKVLECETSS